jgi:hypothetical protein
MDIPLGGERLKVNDRRKNQKDERSNHGLERISAILCGVLRPCCLPGWKESRNSRRMQEEVAELGDAAEDM